MKIVFSYNKTGYEAEFWAREISAASNGEFTFIPFNHDPYLDVNRYLRAQLLDNVYFARNVGLQRMYADMEATVKRHGADALLVMCCPPYHPDYLRRLPIYKALWIADGPMSAYDRDFAYQHAYDHILYHSPAYSRDMDMGEKLAYLGARRADLCPLALFDVGYDPTQTEATLFTHERDIDILFIGAMHINKMPMLAKVKRAFGRRCRIHGVTSLKRNLYFNAKFGFPGWVRPVGFDEYVGLYQRTKIGFNVHNRGEYTVGGYRMFELPANGVMQICDGGEHLNAFFEVGKEVVGYQYADDLIDKLGYYLKHDDERRQIAHAGFQRVTRTHRFAQRMHEVGTLLKQGLSATGSRRRVQ